MANIKGATKVATVESTTKDNNVVLPRKIQTQVKVLREARNIIKQSKGLEKSSRDEILNFVGDITASIIGTDARGTRLISVKVIESSEAFDWDSFLKNDPELHAVLTKKYKIAKGSGTPTLRVDII